VNVRRGDIVIVDFPYSDRTGSKVRPALVVQSDVWNQRIDDTILALITSSSQRRVGVPTQYFIDVSTVEGQRTKLRLNSIVQCENLITHDQRLILRVIGGLSDVAMEKTDTCLKAALGIQ
jgi:mRNA interferase MazF